MKSIARISLLKTLSMYNQILYFKRKRSFFGMQFKPPSNVFTIQTIDKLRIAYLIGSYRGLCWFEMARWKQFEIYSVNVTPYKLILSKGLKFTITKNQSYTERLNRFNAVVPPNGMMSKIIYILPLISSRQYTASWRIRLSRGSALKGLPHCSCW